MHVLELTGITRRFSPAAPPAVDDVSFRVEPGEIFGLLGPSGCGKTTTLRIIGGFECPDRGRVAIRDQDVSTLPPERRRVGFVFQDYALFPHLSVIRNVMFGLGARRPSAGVAARPGRGAPARELARDYLARVGLSGVDERMPDELSGGQQQRVAIARALAAGPELLLLDEPFSNLDVALRDATRREVRAILKDQGLNAILVTHDQEEALSFCDRLAVMNEGRIEQIGTPEEVYHRPRTAFVAQFLGRANLLEGIASGAVAETELGRIPIRPEASGPVLLSLRPEHLELTRATGPSAEAPARDAPAAALAMPATVVGLVEAREFRGHDLTYRVRFGDRSLLAHTEYTRSFYPGDRVTLAPREPAVVLGQSARLLE